jgi:diguanylate cyclase (GGDEF)-like protein/PAS domain S-box-containing protein
LLSALLCGCIPANVSDNTPKAKKGILDLRSWDFEDNGTISLCGEWSFFWEKLVPQNEISAAREKSFETVPSVWTKYKTAAGDLTAEGYATYFLKVLLPETDHVLGFYTKGQGSAYSMWVNGKLIAQNGSVGNSIESMAPGKVPGSFFYKPDKNILEIVIHISNFHHKKAGFRNPILLGYAGSVQSVQLQNWFIESFSVGILFIIGLYYIFLFIFRTRNKATLFFSILCFAISIRLGITNQSTLLFLFPFVNWTFAIKIEYLVFFCNPLPFLYYLKMIFPQEIPKWFVRAVSILAIIFSMLILLPGTMLLTRTAVMYQFVYLIEIIFCLVFLVKIIIMRRSGALYVGTASLILFISIILETLILNNQVAGLRFACTLPVEHVTSFGFLAFIFVQSIMLANHFSQSFTKVETLSKQLELTNKRLQDSERKFRAIFVHSKDLIFICEVNGKITEASPAAEDILGYTKTELLGKKITALLVNKTDSRRMLEKINNEVSIKNYEIPLKRKDRKVIHTLISATQRFDDKGTLIGYQGAVHDITSRKQAQAERSRALELEQIAITDPLTKIYNRRFFRDAARRELERAKRKKTRLSLIMIDIDHFKQVNDSFGHVTGDKVLVNLAAFCSKNIRGMDLFARFGGEEFIILMPETAARDAFVKTDKMRSLIASRKMAIFRKDEVFITISAGISEWKPGQSGSLNELIEYADTALYRSKQSGRNMVSVAENQEQN